jgi:large subunit ribosomal protein L7/L12
MTVIELVELVDAFKEEFGVTAAAPIAMMPGMPVAGAAPAEAAVEQTEFDVILTSGGSEKIKVIKEVRAITSLGLKEAKDLVEGTPAPLKQAVSKAEAEDIKKKIEAVGGAVQIK